MKKSIIFNSLSVVFILLGITLIVAAFAMPFSDRMDHLGSGSGAVAIACLFVLGCLLLRASHAAADEAFHHLNTTEHPQWIRQQQANKEYAKRKANLATLTHVFDTNAQMSWPDGSACAVHFDRVPMGMRIGDQLALVMGPEMARSPRPEAIAIVHACQETEFVGGQYPQWVLIALTGQTQTHGRAYLVGLLAGERLRMAMAE